MMFGEVTLRGRLVTALAILGALGATVAGSLTAYASPAEQPAYTFSVVSTGASPGDPDQLMIVVDSPSTLTGLTAYLDDYAEVLTEQSSETDPTDSTQTETTWTADIPDGTSGLALGTYSIGLSGTFSDPGSYEDYNLGSVGVFNFDAASSVTLTAANADTSYPDTDAGLSGTVTLTYPDGTTPDTDYSGLSVLIEVGANSNEIAELPVASDGTFSDPSYAPYTSEYVVAEVIGAGIDSSLSAPLTLTVTNTTPALTLNVNPVTEIYGKTATVTGTLTYTPGSTAEPIADQEIWISTEQGGSYNPVATGATTADGTFSIPIPAEQSGTTLYVGTLNVSDLNPVETSLQVDVVNPTVISGLKVSLSQSWNLSVSGCLGFASGNKAQTFHHTSGLTVQYASKPTGTWKNLFDINGNESVTPCGTGGIKFTGSHAAPENYAYYRVVYAGTKGATAYAASASGAVLSWRYADRVTGLKVSPTVVNAGGKLTVKGTLQYYYGGWHNYGSQVVWIELRPQGSSTWYWMVKVKTNSKGQFSSTFKDPASATWDVYFPGNNDNGVGHLATVSSQTYVRLK
jgi:hypothetical protein